MGEHLNKNAIKNLPITMGDINVAEQIFLSGYWYIQVKNNLSKPAPVVPEYMIID
jgi:hypothetical protein